ncbi:MAG: sugar transferase [Flavobacteriales bacterium]|nr:sugar transferase [Flavobacteriales bacterium]
MYKFIKRLFDFLMSLMAILILSPILIPIIILLKLTGEGYVFYFQKRIGYQAKHFDIWKFATMLKDSPNMGTGYITLRKDPRITPMGGFLRMTKINELPQIFNVLLGQMSFVGPRPLVDKNFKNIDQSIKEKIYSNKPGITGIGSIVFRDEEKLLSETTMPPEQFYDQVIMPYKTSLELWYTENISFMTDLKILVLTALVILLPGNRLYLKWFKNLPQANFKI